MRAPTRLLAATVIALTATAALALPAEAAPAAKAYANCTAINRVYSGGIARSGVKFNTTHYRGKVYHRALKGHVKFSTALYEANRKSDRDKDGIACEKS
jgi:Excalibur calcium-binding domain